jgi:transcription initiation factor TFIID TATA-box-binding protein
MYPRVCNIVASVQLSCSLSLSALSARMNNCEYNPRRFNPLIARTKSPRTTALIYASGKFVITGARCMEDLDQAVRVHVRAIMKAGNPACRWVSTSITNMVASVDIRAPLRLDALQMALGGFSGGANLDSEIFPGLIYRLCDPAVTMNIFSTGKVIILGASSYPVIIAAIEKTLPIFLLYKRD